MVELDAAINTSDSQLDEIEKSLTGIKGLDELTDGGLVMGTDRISQEADEMADFTATERETERRRRELENRLSFLKAGMDALRLECESSEVDLNKLVLEDKLQSKAAANGRRDMARLRGADPS